MDTNLNLYPDKMIAQCINAISLLSDANEALSSLKFEINEFVNDSYIHSVSFDELKKQCQNYTTVIDAMISCNEADIADFGILESVLDGVHEDLIGEKIDYWEKYYQALINKYNSLLDSGVHSQLQAYFGTLLSTYQELYNMWYAKELLYYEVDSKTSSLFAKSYGRQTISNMLAGLKTSFTLNDGYNANVVAAQKADIEKAITESVHMEPEVKAVWDALIISGKSFNKSDKFIKYIELNHPEVLVNVKHIISSVGYEEGVKIAGEYIENKIIPTKLSSDGYDYLTRLEINSSLIHYDEEGNIVEIKNHDVGDGGVTIGMGIFVSYSDEKELMRLKSKGINVNVGEWNTYDDVYELYCERSIKYEENVNNIVNRNDLLLTQNQYDAIYVMVYNRPALSVEGAAYDKYFSSNNPTCEKYIDSLVDEYKTLKTWDSYGEGWTNRIKNSADVYFDSDYSKKY